MQSRLLALPRELRNLIYEDTFSTTVDLREAFLRRSHQLPPLEVCNKGLLLTCRQIHHECDKLYYTHSIFYAQQLYEQPFYDCGRDIAAVRSAIPERHRRNVQEVRYEFEDYHSNVQKRCNLTWMIGRLELQEGIVFREGVVETNYRVRIVSEDGGERWETSWAAELPEEDWIDDDPSW